MPNEGAGELLKAPTKVAPHETKCSTRYRSATGSEFRSHERQRLTVVGMNVLVEVCRAASHHIRRTVGCRNYQECPAMILANASDTAKNRDCQAPDHEHPCKQRFNPFSTLVYIHQNSTQIQVFRPHSRTAVLNGLLLSYNTYLGRHGFPVTYKGMPRFPRYRTPGSSEYCNISVPHSSRKPCIRDVPGLDVIFRAIPSPNRDHTAVQTW